MPYAALQERFKKALELLDLALAEREAMHGQMRGSPKHWTHEAKALLEADLAKDSANG